MRLLGRLKRKKDLSLSSLSSLCHERIPERMVGYFPYKTAAMERSLMGFLMELQPNSESPATGSLHEKGGRTTSMRNPLQENNLLIISTDHSREKSKDIANFCIAAASDEEKKIRRELEKEIERGIEEEIKDEICRLALRLHRLYQHQSGRTGMLAFTEVKTTFHVERGCKVEINVSNMGGRPGELEGRPRRSRAEAKHGKTVLGTKQLDWASSLRSGARNHTAMNRKREISRQVHDCNRRDHRGSSNEQFRTGWRL